MMSLVYLFLTSRKSSQTQDAGKVTNKHTPMKPEIPGYITAASACQYEIFYCVCTYKIKELQVLHVRNLAITAPCPGRRILIFLFPFILIPTEGLL